MSTTSSHRRHLTKIQSDWRKLRPAITATIACDTPEQPPQFVKELELYQSILIIQGKLSTLLRALATDPSLKELLKCNNLITSLQTASRLAENVDTDVHESLKTSLGGLQSRRTRLTRSLKENRNLMELAQQVASEVETYGGFLSVLQNTRQWHGRGIDPAPLKQPAPTSPPD